MQSYVRRHIREMAAYLPGEQPQEAGYIKLNTNENPYPPSPRVLEAIESVLHSDRIRKYPDPCGTKFRQTAARVHGVDPDSVLIGNGSDDILNILVRGFVGEGGLIVTPSPTYLLYETLAKIQGARIERVPYSREWTLPEWTVRSADLTIVANPNSPSGTMVAVNFLDDLANAVTGPLVIDEAYVDFASDNALRLAARGHAIVTRSLSKSHSLAGIRFGYAVGDPRVIGELGKVKDSYNCDVLSLAAASAALEDQGYLQKTRERILKTRDRLQRELSRLGFAVCPSEANFVWCQHPSQSARRIYEELKGRKILIRYMKYDGFEEGLRISVGTDHEIDQLLLELSTLL